MNHDGAPEHDSIEALSNAVTQLRAERDGLRAAMRHRAVIEQAKGILANRFAVTPDDAFGRLAELSSRTNVKVADLAAAVVAGQLPGDLDTPDYEIPTDQTSQSPSDHLIDDTDLSVDIGGVSARLQLLGSRLAAADSCDALAHTVTGDDCWPKPATAMVFRHEPDGALSLAGSAGLSSSAQSRWARIPPMRDLPLISVVNHRSAVVVTDPTAIARHFPVSGEHRDEAVIAVPLNHDDHVVGVLAMTWGEAPPDPEVVLSRMTAVADTCARRFEKLTAKPADEPAEPGALALFLEAMSEPAVVLGPVWSNGQVVDFTIELASPAARDAARIEQLNQSGGTLLTTLPEVGSRVLLPALTEVLNTGDPRQLSDVFIAGEREGTAVDYRIDARAVRLWDRIIFTWRVAGDAERLWEQTRFTETATHSGSIRFDPDTGHTQWSPGALALLGREPGDEPADISFLTELANPDDADRLRRDLNAAPGDTIRGRIRGVGDFAGREFAVTVHAEPANGTVTVVLRDVRAAGDVGGEHDRIAAAAERARLIETETRLKALTAPISQTVDHIACRAVETEPGGPAWHDTIRLGEGTILVVVGEVTSGPVDITVARLRHAAIGYAIAGMAPDEILTNLNSLCCHHGDATAAVSIATLDAKENLTDWASAGRNAPIVVDAVGRARWQSGALGMALGAAPGLKYQANRVELEPASRLFLYTESILTIPDTPLPETLAALLSAATRPDPDDALGELSRALPHLDRPLCLVSAQLAG
ncbi:stage II sporulation protein E [Stackebrandtia endophytica]|uniref:Stage II sporulation protein E n=1 Tax=Stackebrandtia endophytica TaxID=1496996 RepID=A0A543AUQ9_9ACTN|nr:ANTAR domain-containing protein [Stackebrandtia endophytica]TQL76295.1 stage II sporulation protein E [Stackebrandtia endophytica]